MAASDSRELASGFDLTSPPADYFRDPARYFRALREIDPFHRNRDGSLLLTRYADVRTVWRDLTGTVDKYEQFRTRFADGPLTDYYGTNMPFSDPPRHDRLRALLNPFFTPRTMQRLIRPIEDRVEALLDKLAAKRDVDFVADYALRLPIDVISMLIGIPREDGFYLRDLSEKIVNPLNANHPSAEMPFVHQATLDFIDYLRPHLDALRRRPEIDPGESVLATLAAAERAGNEITEQEILHCCMLMFIGGHGTTMNMLGASVHTLLDNPDQRARLIAEPQMLDKAVEELIRFISPTQLQGRRTTQPISLPSGDLPAGTEIMLCPAAANRDGATFADPDRLMLDREPNPHIAFGAGVHLHRPSTG